MKMSSKPTGLSQERRERAYREAVDYRTFIEEAQVNKQTLAYNYEAYKLEPQEIEFLTRLDEPVDVLALAHDWCGDVVANLPLLAKLEAETGKLKLRILPRDPDNTDIAALYLHADGKSHIPAYIFFNQAGEELGVFIERADEITALLGEWREQFWTHHPDWTAGASRSELWRMG